VRGCEKISPGCKHCYAETFAERFRGVPAHPYEQGFDPALVPGKLGDPLQWSTPRRVFVNSMSDLFQRDVPDAYIRRVVNVMLTAHWHTYQVLTKRADRMHDLLQGSLRDAAEAEHIWWGVSVEDRKYGVPRIDLLRRAPGRTRFLSIEPLLEGLGELALEDIHWVIAGGESGRGARPMDPQWVRDIRDQCAAAEVPFFFKQWGGVQKGRAGRLLDGRTHDGMPPRAPSTVPPRAERRGLSAALLVMGEPALIPVTALRSRAHPAAPPAA
jgi:protein gp37